MVSDQKHESPVRRRLLESAMRHFLERDYHRVSMRAVASEAGTTMSMVYYYFGNKEGLFEEVLRGWLAPLIDDMRSSNPERSPDSIEAFFRMYYRAALVHPRFPLLIMKTINSNDAPGRAISAKPCWSAAAVPASPGSGACRPRVRSPPISIPNCCASRR